MQTQTCLVRLLQTSEAATAHSGELGAGAGQEAALEQGAPDSAAAAAAAAAAALGQLAAALTTQFQASATAALNTCSFSVP